MTEAGGMGTRDWKRGLLPTLALSHLAAMFDPPHLHSMQGAESSITTTAPHHQTFLIVQRIFIRSGMARDMGYNHRRAVKKVRTLALSLRH
jgi:hypothetical protein